MLLQLRLAPAKESKDMLEQEKEKDEDNWEQEDGEHDGSVGPEVEAGEVVGGHHGGRQIDQCQAVVGQHNSEGGQKDQLHSCLAQC